MGLRHMVVTAFLTGCICLPGMAQQVDNVTFNNSDGMFSGTGLDSGTLSLNNSILTQITGALGGFHTTGTNLGTLNFKSGLLNSGGTMAATITGGKISFTDDAGFTDFNLTVTPEAGTLVLFGSGLIAVGALVKFGRQRKREL